MKEITIQKLLKNRNNISITLGDKRVKKIKVILPSKSRYPLEESYLFSGKMKMEINESILTTGVSEPIYNVTVTRGADVPVQYTNIRETSILNSCKDQEEHKITIIKQMSIHEDDNKLSVKEILLKLDIKYILPLGGPVLSNFDDNRFFIDKIEIDTDKTLSYHVSNLHYFNKGNSENFGPYSSVELLQRLKIEDYITENGIWIIQEG